jgi:hypothetical protein
LVISALIEIIKDEKTNKKNKREDDKRWQEP